MQMPFAISTTITSLKIARYGIGYVTPLSHEQFTQHVDYSHGSVRDQIVHLMSVDDVWFSELRGVEPSELSSAANLTIGISFAHTGTTSSKICASILRNCGTICYSKSRSKNRRRQRPDRVASAAPCGESWHRSSRTTAQIAQRSGRQDNVARLHFLCLWAPYAHFRRRDG